MQRGGCLNDGAGAEQPELLRGHTFEGADFQFLAANVVYKPGHRHDHQARQGRRHGSPEARGPHDPAAVLGQEHRPGRQDRLHRHDAQGHPDHRHPGRRRGPASSRDEVATANALVPRPAPQGRQRDRRAHPPGRHPVLQRGSARTAQTYDVNPTYDYTCGKGGSLTLTRRSSPIAPEPRPADRHGRLRPHPPALRLQRPGPQGPAAPGDLGVVLRPPLHRDRPEATTAARRRHRARLGQGLQHGRHPRRGEGRRRRRRSSTDYIDAGRAHRQQGARARSPTDVTRSRHAARRVGARRPHRRRPAQRTPRSSPAASTVDRVHEPRRHPGRPDVRAAPHGEATGDVTFEEAFTVQPFNNYLVSMDLTGSQTSRPARPAVDRAATSGTAPKILQVSRASSTPDVGATGPELAR